MYLAQRAEKVLVVIRGEDLNKSMSSYLVRRIEKMANVEVLKNTHVRRCEGVTSLAKERWVRGSEPDLRQFGGGLVRNIFTSAPLPKRAFSSATEV